MKRRRAAISVFTLVAVVSVVCIGAGYLAAQQDGTPNTQPANDSASPEVKQLAQDRVSRFAAVDIVIDAKDQPLAAYQVSFAASQGDIRITSIEGGEHAAFAEPPFYDPKAIQNERAVFAGFSTNEAKDLPIGKTRIATVHVEIRGNVEPEYELKLSVAATVGGESIPVQLHVLTPRGSL